jgi:hypothetical protein
MSVRVDVMVKPQMSGSRFFKAPYPG